MGQSCKFNEAWVGRCGKPVLEGQEFCQKHAKARCWCGAQATRNCDIAVSLVCGQPLCDEHGCNVIGRGMTGHGPHDEEGQRQYTAWKQAQEG